MQDKKNLVAIALVFLFSIAVAFSNLAEQKAVDESKIPEKVEESRGFQRWITNMKNKDLEVEADEFELVEQNEIYNTKWIKIYSSDDDTQKAEYDKQIAEHKDLEDVEFSPSERAFVDWRQLERYDYKPNEVRYYGLRDDKIFDARIVDCSVRANCYFDRAYFLDSSNDLFVISEFSMDIPDEDSEETFVPCSIDTECTYTIKVHVVDMINNKRSIYKSEEKQLVLSEVIPEL